MLGRGVRNSACSSRRPGSDGSVSDAFAAIPAVNVAPTVPVTGTAALLSMASASDGLATLSHCAPGNAQTVSVNAPDILPAIVPPLSVNENASVRLPAPNAFDLPVNVTSVLSALISVTVSVIVNTTSITTCLKNSFRMPSVTASRKSSTPSTV